MGYNFMVETAREALDYLENNDCTSVPVEGGYMVLEWYDYYRRIKDEAASLYDGGWRGSDLDCIDTLIKEYCVEDNKIIREWAGDIVSALNDLEEKEREDNEG